MPIAGTRKKTRIEDYSNSAFSGIAQQFSQVAKAIQEQECIHPFGQPALTMLNENAVDTFKNFFVEGSYDKALYESTNDLKGLQEYKKDMGELFQNDVECIREYTSMNSVNPIVTTGLAMHKLIMMRNIFDKGVIQSHVAVSPNFTIQMQYRYLVKPDGTKVDLAREQNKITDAFYSVNPEREIELSLPLDSSKLTSGQRLVEQCNGVLGRDNLTTETFVCSIAVENPKYTKDGSEPQYIWIKKKIEFLPGYGSNTVVRLNSDPIDLTEFLEKDGNSKIDYLSGQLANNEMVIFSANGLIKKIKINTKLDPSNGMLSVCSATWDTDEKFVRIDNANPMNVPISPEEVKDIEALYGVNQLSMVMSIINDVLGNVKDDTIRRKLLSSYENLPEQERMWSYFDMKPREGYNRDHVSWRYSSFMDVFDTFVTNLLYILNDENVTVSVFGRPDIIRKITPTEYSYQAPGNIGPVSIEYNRTIATSDNRTYNFVSSQKLGASNDLAVILNPNNSQRIIYRVYNYQFYVSNEIRNADQVTLPGVHAFERFKFYEYQPVQGRFRILNPSGRDESAKPQDALNDLIKLNPNFKSE